MRLASTCVCMYILDSTRTDESALVEKYASCDLNSVASVREIGTIVCIVVGREDVRRAAIDIRNFNLSSACKPNERL